MSCNSATDCEISQNITKTMEAETAEEKPIDFKLAYEETLKVIDENPRKKRKLVRTTIQFKKEIIEKFESGARVRELSLEYKMPRSTISTILKHREVIKAADVAKGVKAVTKQRPRVLEEVEKLLLIWINKKQLDGDTITEPIVCKKAKQLFLDLLKNKSTASINENETFKASRGWYENFKKRSGISRHGETATARKISAESFTDDFKNYIKTERLFPQQVFTCNETGLFWRKLPKKTFIIQEEMASPGHRPMNDRVTLLLCSNASGDLKLKPLMVYHSENPRAFYRNHVNKKDLPVLWRSHPKGWITKQLFIEWMNKVFGPTVKKYLLNKNLSLKALFLLDNAPTHPVDLEDSLDDDFNFITIRFMPPDVTSLIRPLDQDVISSLKKLYTKVLLQKCFSVTSNSEMSLREFWKNHFSILHSIHLIDEAWCEVSDTRINVSWKRVWPDGVFKVESEIHEAEATATMEEILSLCQTLDLKINCSDVEEMFLDLRGDLTTQELQELQKEQERLISVEISAGIEEMKEEFPLCLIKNMCMKWAEVESLIRKYHPDQRSISRLLNAMNEEVFSYFTDILSANEIK